MKHITPPGIRAPFARYSYGVEIPPGHRILVCSGQLGISAADQVPPTIEEQTHLCFRNIGALLEAASLPSPTSSALTPSSCRASTSRAT